jgi:hypothetical protein
MTRSRTSAVLSVCLCVLAVCLLAWSCGPLSRLDAVPVVTEQHATVPNMPGIRYWGDADPASFLRASEEAYGRELALFRAAGHQGDLPRLHAGELHDPARGAVRYGIHARAVPGRIRHGSPGLPWAKVPPGYTAPQVEPPLPAPAHDALSAAGSAS